MRKPLGVVALVIACAGCELYFGHGSTPGSGPGLGTDAGPGGGSGYPDGGPIDPPPGRVQILVNGLDDPTKIALDGDYIYWTNTARGSAGSVMRVAKTGGKPEYLALAQTFPVGLVVDDQDVYWTNTGIGAGSGQVMRVTKAGGEPVVVAGGLNWPGDLVGDRDYLYWRDDTKGLERIAKRGGTEPQLLVPSQTLSGAIAIDDTRVYFNDVSAAAIQAVPKAGGIATLVVDGSDVYWHNGGVDSLWHARTTGGAPATPIFGGGFEMRHIAVTRDALFITQMGEPIEISPPGPGAIHQIPRNGGHDRVMTPRDIGFWGIAVDDHALYWTNLANGTLNTIGR
jgi:hypothetical protein